MCIYILKKRRITHIKKSEINNQCLPPHDRETNFKARQGLQHCIAQPPIFLLLSLAKIKNQRIKTKKKRIKKLVKREKTLRIKGETKTATLFSSVANFSAAELSRN